jgi:hypothetical protein
MMKKMPTLRKVPMCKWQAQGVLLT